MADEFVKGFGILTFGIFGWMTIASWYNTPSFEGTQLVGPAPENPDVYAQLALVTGDALLWFSILGVLAFWVLVPAVQRFRGPGEE